jgi:hypothetical protein
VIAYTVPCWCYWCVGLACRSVYYINRDTVVTYTVGILIVLLLVAIKTIKMHPTSIKITFISNWGMCLH